MYVVIFKARVKEADALYSETAGKLRELALESYGCLEFSSATEGANEIALSYWPDEDSIRKWKAHADHLMAQRLGREKWYAWYSVEVAEIKRRYTSDQG